jgi:hypothetical protein
VTRSKKARPTQEQVSRIASRHEPWFTPRVVIGHWSLVLFEAGFAVAMPTTND